jgi:hypothetical protein
MRSAESRVRSAAGRLHRFHNAAGAQATRRKVARYVREYADYYCHHQTDRHYLNWIPLK